jgi:serine/threonine-protein kinase RsbW
MALTLPGDVNAAGHVRSVVEVWLTRLDVATASRDDIGLIVDEACANAAKHVRVSGDIDVRITVGDHECVIDVGNSDGPARDEPVQADLPDPLAESGRGLAIISTLADATQIRREPSRVILHTTVRITRGGSSPGRHTEPR